MLVTAGLGQAVGFAKDVAGDIVEGRDIRQSLKQRGISRLKNTAISGLSTITGRPLGRRRRPAGRVAPLGKRQAAPLRKQPRRKKQRQALF